MARLPSWKLGAQMELIGGSNPYEKHESQLGSLFPYMRNYFKRSKPPIRKSRDDSCWTAITIINMEVSKRSHSADPWWKRFWSWKWGESTGQNRAQFSLKKTCLHEAYRCHKNESLTASCVFCSLGSHLWRCENSTKPTKLLEEL